MTTVFKSSNGFSNMRVFAMLLRELNDADLHETIGQSSSHTRMLEAFGRITKSIVREDGA
jgi:hypothetical protein